MLPVKATAVMDTLEAIKARAEKEKLEKIVAPLEAEDTEILPKAPLAILVVLRRRLCALARSRHPGDRRGKPGRACQAR